MPVCPITSEIMRDPVVASDGHTYERSAIENWLRTNSASPMTDQVLPSKCLFPNHELRSIFLERYPEMMGFSAVAHDRR